MPSGALAMYMIRRRMQMGTDNMTLGPGILYIDDKPIGTGVLDSEFDSIKYDDLPTMTLSKEAEFELESALDLDLINQVIGKFSEPQPFYMEFDGVCYEQVRKHKKKRINKKWAKRYGYREVPCRYRMEHAYIQHNTINDFDIIADPPKIICSSLYGRMGRPIFSKGE